MKIKVTQCGVVIASSCNMVVIPQIGEKIVICGGKHKIVDVIWHVENEVYVEIVID